MAPRRIVRRSLGWVAVLGLAVATYATFGYERPYGDDQYSLFRVWQFARDPSQLGIGQSASANAMLRQGFAHVALVLLPAVAVGVICGATWVGIRVSSWRAERRVIRRAAMGGSAQTPYARGVRDRPE